MKTKCKTCKECIYRDDCMTSISKNYSCNDFKYGDPENLAEEEQDINDYTGDESFDDFMDHEYNE